MLTNNAKEVQATWKILSSLDDKDTGLGEGEEDEDQMEMDEEMLQEKEKERIRNDRCMKLQMI